MEALYVINVHAKSHTLLWQHQTSSFLILVQTLYLRSKMWVLLYWYQYTECKQAEIDQRVGNSAADMYLLIHFYYSERLQVCLPSCAYLEGDFKLRNVKLLHRDSFIRCQIKKKRLQEWVSVKPQSESQYRAARIKTKHQVTLIVNTHRTRMCTSVRITNSLQDYTHSAK